MEVNVCGNCKCCESIKKILQIKILAAYASFTSIYKFYILKFFIIFINATPFISFVSVDKVKNGALNFMKREIFVSWIECGFDLFWYGKDSPTFKCKYYFKKYIAVDFFLFLTEKNNRKILINFIKRHSLN